PGSFADRTRPGQWPRSGEGVRPRAAAPRSLHTERANAIFAEFKKIFYHVDFSLDYSGKLRHLWFHSSSPLMGWQEEATVVRLSTHISALCAANAWSSNRPSVCRYALLGWSGSVSFSDKRPEQAFKTPG